MKTRITELLGIEYPIVQGAMGIVSGGAHIFGHEIRAIFEAFSALSQAARRR